MRQAEKAGWLGFLGVALVFFGSSIFISFLGIVSLAVPLVAAEAPGLLSRLMTPPVYILPIFLVSFLLGMILLGVATMKAGVFPRWAGLMLIVGQILQLAEGAPLDPVIMHVFLTIGRVLVGAGLAWMGGVLWLEPLEQNQAGQAAVRVSSPRGT